ncbi:MAG: hypothetical protein IPL79_17485 [Myxococcales bacterium]|nr:hypothetical protein [Myxococcales bacterium]
MQRALIILALLHFGCSTDNNSGNNPPGDGGPDGGGDGGDDGPSGDPVDVHVSITADNAYGFGYGSQTSLAHYFLGVEDGGGQIFFCSAACDEQTPCGGDLTCDQFGTCNGDRMGPEMYVVPASATQGVEYLYVITWSDESVTQGLIAQFATSNGANTIYTGDAAWEVCATGVDYDPGTGGPSTTVIDDYLAKCTNTPGDTFSNGWLGTTPNGAGRGLVILEPAQETGNFGNVCGRQAGDAGKGDALDAGAKWIWFDDDVGASPGAFTSNGQPRGDFLIFRLPLGVVVPPIS